MNCYNCAVRLRCRVWSQQLLAQGTAARDGTNSKRGSASVERDARNDSNVDRSARADSNASNIDGGNISSSADRNYMRQETRTLLRQTTSRVSMLEE
jgi:hypothetical protein